MAKSYSCQCLATETFTQDDKDYTTKPLNISYSSYLYIRLVVTLQFASLINNEDNSY